MSTPLLTIVAREEDWHVRQIADAVRGRGITVQILSGSGEEVERTITNLSHALILWRSARLPSARRTALLRSAQARGCQLINQALASCPEVRSKRYQQAAVLEEPNMRGIPTQSFPDKTSLLVACDEGKISLPGIAKPHIGSQGNGVLLLTSRKDLETIPEEDIPSLIFQPFIQNTGDYRVIVVGGMPLGVMRRVGKQGDHRNNISQGGHAERITDTAEEREVIEMGTRVATLFRLQICGVDLIRDAHTGDLHFLEVNTVPEWGDEGFQKTTGIVVGEKIATYVSTLLDARTQPFHEVVRQWYEKNTIPLPHIAFHWWTRRFLWYRDTKAKKEVEARRSMIFGTTGNIRDYFSSLLTDNQSAEHFSPERRAVLVNYPDLLGIYTILIKTLLAQTLYGENVRKEALQVIGKERMLDSWQRLHEDRNGFIILSTYAVNTIDFIALLFGETLHLTVDPSLTLEALEDGLQDQKRYRLRDTLYLATHAVIGASAFYDRPIIQHRDAYRQMLEDAQTHIRLHMDTLPLDVRLEFVVATHLLGIISPLEQRILQEARDTRDPFGVYVTDPKKRQGANVLKAEHRNILFWMANTPWHRS